MTAFTRFAFTRFKDSFLVLPWVLAFAILGCSTSAKKKSVSPSPAPALSALLGQKVALISVEGEPTAKRIIEVALVNQLVQKGTFILLSREAVETARSAPDQDPLDWKGIAQRAGADYALQAKVLQFEAPVQEGYSTRDIVDSQLAEEQGTDGKTQQVFRVKSMEGHVKVELAFTHLQDHDRRSAIAEASDKVEASAQDSAIHFPPQLRFLEDLTNKAFQRFFEQFN